jgi:hypothetical protein
LASTISPEIKEKQRALDRPIIFIVPFLQSAVHMSYLHLST